MISSYSNEKKIPDTGLEYRNIEYVHKLCLNNAIHETVYSAHKEFFSKEIIEFVSQKYGVNISGDKIFYGVSNGGAFGIDLAYGDEEEEMLRQYGIEELSDLIQQLQSQDYLIEVNTYKGGHDRTLWKNEFANFITLINKHILIKKYLVENTPS